MSAPVTVAGPSTSIIIVADSSLSTSKTNFLRFKIIDVTSSTTPSTAENSWIAPWTLIAYTADPGKEDRRTRRSEFPKVVPKPLSKGSITNLP